MRHVVIAFVLALLSLVMTPIPASAHQDGCHRWHSCPSDNGSYVCGDLGHACQYPTYDSPTRVPGLAPDATTGEILNHFHEQAKLDEQRMEEAGTTGNDFPLGEAVFWVVALFLGYSACRLLFSKPS